MMLVCIVAISARLGAPCPGVLNLSTADVREANNGTMRFGSNAKMQAQVLQKLRVTGCVVLTLIGEEPWQSKFKAMLLFRI